MANHKKKFMKRLAQKEVNKLRPMKASSFHSLEVMKIMGLHHHPCNDDGLYDGRVLPSSHSKYIFAVSFLSAVSGIYAISRGYFDLSPAPFGVFLTSINYWRDPTISWRRNLDITYVFLSLIYQSVRAAWAEFGFYFYAINAIGIFCFAASWFIFPTHSGFSALFHVLVHVLGNVANVVLYSGHVEGVM